MNQRQRTDWLLLAGFCGFLFFFGLAHFGLVGADEPRYAQVAREMLARHDWITPTLGGTPWLEKPALYYWQAMLAYRVFGVSDWAARLPSAVDAFLLVVAVYLFLRRFRPGFQLDGALMTASAAGVVGFARAASMDMPLAAAFSIALLAWYAWHESGSRGYLASFYVFLGLAVLAKGPVALFLAALIIVMFVAVTGEMRLLWRTLWIPGIGLFLLVALPWYVAVQIRNPEFFRVFVLEHNLARFGADLYHHTQPFWFFLPVALLGLLPWTVYAAAAVFENVRAWWAEGRELLRSEDALNPFLMIWLMAPVVFFSVSQSKLPGYVLPALPAGTLLLAEYLRRHVSEGERPQLLLVILHSVVAAIPVIPAVMIGEVVLQHRLPWGRGTAVACVFAMVLAIAMVVTLRTKLGLRMLRFVTLVPVLLTVGYVLRTGAVVLDTRLSVRPIAREIRQVETKPLPLAVLRVSREIEFGLQFYRDQNIPRYELNQIPDGEHLVLAGEGMRARIEKRIPGRRVSYLGRLGMQHLEYYWVSAPGMAQEPGHSH